MIVWPSKDTDEVLDFTWAAPLDPGDTLSSYTAAASGVVIDSDNNTGTEITLWLSGGTAGQTGMIALEATTTLGRTLAETLYIPIVESAAQIAATARDYVNFALRKVVGLGESAEADELADALERLSGLIARWREGGADIGAPFPLTASSIIYCPDWAVSALRYNLLIECAPLYGLEPTAMEYENARRGLQLVKHKNLPAEREAEYF